MILNQKLKIGKILNDEYNRNVFLNYFFKVVSILLGLINTRITLEYLGDNLYGLWVTVTSVISWMSSGDLGIGNGLRNGLATAYGENDKKKQRELIETAFSTLLQLSFVLMVILACICEILFHTNILNSDVRIPMYITAIFFCANLVLGISQSVALGYQRSWLATLTLCEMQILSIAAVLVLSSCKINANLNVFAVANGIGTTLPNIILIYILSLNGIKVINKTNIRRTKENRNTKKIIMNTGMQFFGIQICSVILYSTDSLIINKLINSEMVTKYAIITKIYDTGTSLFSILLIALWSAVTYNLAKNNLDWIKKKIKQLIFYWLVFSFGVVIVSIMFNDIVKIWLGGQAIYYEWTIICLFGTYCSMTAFSAIFVNVLNGMGVVKLQLVLAIIAAVVNIPLSVFLAQNCSLGIIGVKLATFISAMITAIVMPIQAMVEIKKEIRKRNNNENSSNY